MENAVGFAAVFNHKIISGSLLIESSIFTAELLAIEAALNEIQKLEEKHWTIFLDSQSAIQSIQQYKPKHPIVQRLQDLVHETGK